MQRMDRCKIISEFFLIIPASVLFESGIYRTVEEFEQKVHCRMTGNNSSDGGELLFNRLEIG
jgi:hypothetical protein